MDRLQLLFIIVGLIFILQGVMEANKLKEQAEGFLFSQGLLKQENLVTGEEPAPPPLNQITIEPGEEAVTPQSQIEKKPSLVLREEKIQPLPLPQPPPPPPSPATGVEETPAPPPPEEPAQESAEEQQKKALDEFLKKQEALKKSQTTSTPPEDADTLALKNILNDIQKEAAKTFLVKQEEAMRQQLSEANQTNTSSTPLVEEGPQLNAADLSLGTPEAVFLSVFDGHDHEIAMLKDGQIKAITNNNVPDRNPATMGEWVIWQRLLSSGWEIFAWRNGQERRLTDNNFDDIEPRTDGRNVVWQTNIDGAWQIAYYDLVANKGGLVTTHGMNINPRVDHSKLVWQSWATDHWEIKILEKGLVYQLTNGGFTQHQPEIGHGRIVWRGFDGYNWQVMNYDLGTRELAQLTSEHEDNIDLVNNKDEVLWQKGPNRRDLFSYNAVQKVVQKLDSAKLASVINFRLQLARAAAFFAAQAISKLTLELRNLFASLESSLIQFARSGNLQVFDNHILESSLGTLLSFESIVDPPVDFVASLFPEFGEDELAKKEQASSTIAETLPDSSTSSTSVTAGDSAASSTLAEAPPSESQAASSTAPLATTTQSSNTSGGPVSTTSESQPSSVSSTDAVAPSPQPVLSTDSAQTTSSTEAVPPTHSTAASEPTLATTSASSTEAASPPPASTLTPEPAPATTSTESSPTPTPTPSETQAESPLQE